MRAAALAALVLAQSAGLPMRVLDQGQQSAVEELRTVVASSSDAIIALWRDHSARPVPQVDAVRESVVAVFLGSRPTSGYAVEILSVTTATDGAVVRYRERKPLPRILTAQVLTFPYSIVAVPRLTGPVRFERVE